MRKAKVERKTKESEVLVELNIDGSGQISVETGVPFFDHMLSQLGKHSGFDLTVKTKGDVDEIALDACLERLRGGCLVTRPRSKGHLVTIEGQAHRCVALRNK